ncbi:class I SAM-dependent methyltransferase [Bradyrhizobium sp. LHD-71]|uniref:class I SAM-dependent methyltransferase n=1 Tax=Bradyrhizobium sp. LHD-71 TaxID=3072141 RepID=UPI00280E1E1A|nr:class I SAM-dependent methyltransferase [Bradyrhizobium sp. LHD-71]MDQ8728350.1 class I SAM-dependent methyltransferase [Bradyrhizobium sp. LHD-71]
MKREPTIEKEELDAYLRGIERHPYYAKMLAVKNISMLHVDVLMLLRLLARASRQAILEIGPYIGGSSLAIGSGVRDRGGATYVSIEHGGVEQEIGGTYREHPFYPSSNIVADLNKNLAAEGLQAFVSILVGKSDAPDVVGEAFRLIGEGKIDLLFIDADGAVDRDVETFAPLLAPGCVLVFDDYAAPGAEDKEHRVRAVVDAQVAAKKFESFGVYGWGTWVGRYRG